MKQAKRFHKMIGLAMITILLCICMSTGLADGMPEVTITGEKIVQQNSGTTIQVAGLQEGNSWTYTLYDETDYTTVFSVSINDEGAVMPGEVQIDGEQLQAYHEYRFYVYTYAEQYGSQACDFYFFVTGERDENVTLSFSAGETEKDILINTEETIVIQAPGAEHVEIYDGGWNGIWSDEDGTGKFVCSRSYSTAVTKAITARACYPDGTYGASNTITANVISNGKAQVPTLDWTGTKEVFRGDFVTVPYKEKAEYINYVGMNGDTEEGGWASSYVYGGDAFFGFSTAQFPAGRYKIYLTAKGPGYEENTTAEQAAYDLIVREPEESIKFTLSETDVLKYDNLYYSIYAPGAYEVRLKRVGEDSYEYTYDYSYQSVFCRDLQIVEDTVLYAEAVKYDDEGNETILRTENVTVHCVTNGPLEVDITVPNLIPKGQDAVLTLTGMEAADNSWAVTVRDEDAYSEILYQSGNRRTTAPESIVIDDSLLEAGHTYRVEFGATGTGYDSFSTKKYFMVYEGETDSNISFTLDGESDPEEVLVHKRYNLKITAPGAKLIAWREMGNTDYWNYGNNTDPATGTLQAEEWWGDKGPRTIIAKAYYGEIDEDSPMIYEDLEWGAVCAQPLQFNVTSYGPAPIPTISLADGTTYTRGEFIQANIEADTTKINQRIDLYARRTDGQDSGNIETWYANSGSETFTLSTSSLPAGEYMLVEESYGDGYDAEWVYLDQVTFTVTEPAAGSVNLYVEKGDVLLNETIRAAAYAPGARDVTIYRKRTGESDQPIIDNNWSSYERGDFTIYDSDADGYILYAEAIYYDGETETGRSRSEEITLQVTNNGKLNIGIDMPPFVNIGQETAVTFSGMEQVQLGWNIQIIDVNSWETVFDQSGNRQNAPGSITIDGSELEAGKIYRIDVSASELGYETTDVSQSFLAYEGELDTGMVIAIDGNQTPEELYINKDYELTFMEEGATAIAWMTDNNGSWSWSTTDGTSGTVTSYISWAEPGKHIITAKASHDPISEGAMYEDITWNNPAATRLTCNVTSKGKTQYTLSGMPSTVPAGTNLSVHWVPTQEKQRMYMALCTPETRVTVNDGTSEIESDFEFDGRWLSEPGDYYLECESTAEGYEQTRDEYHFTVTANDQRPDAPAATISGTVYRDIEFQILFDDVQESVYAEIRKDGQHITNAGNDHVNKFSFDLWETGEYDLYVCASVDGVWSELTKVLTFTVEEIPETNDIILIAPEEIGIGEEVYITAILPGQEGEGYITLRDSTGRETGGYTITAGDGYRYANWKLWEDMLVNSQAEPGTATVEAVFTPYGGETSLTATKNVEITGSKPVKPTISVNAEVAEKGETIRLSGKTGSATQIVLTEDYTGNGISRRYYPATAISGGQWTAEITAEKAGYYSFNIKGYANGLYTGSAGVQVIVTGDAELPAPTIETATSEYDSSRVIMNTSTPTMYNETQWIYWLTGPDGNVYTNGSSWSWYEKSFTIELYTPYAGTYTLTALYISNNRVSAPATANVTVTGGRPWPINGPLTITTDVPETWPAGKDLTIHWTPAEAGQEIVLQAYNENREDINVYNSYLANEGDLVIEGRELEPGRYTLHFSSMLDYWEDTTKEIELTITENTERPAAPQVSQISDPIYERIPFTVTFDRMWDKIRLEAIDRVDGSGNDYYETENKDHITLKLPEVGTYDLYAYGSIDQVWSVKQKIGTVTASEIPEVDEITLTVPEQIAIGDDLTVISLMPKRSAYAHFEIQESGEWLYGSSRSFSAEEGCMTWTVTAEELINSGMTPGTLSVTVYTDETEDAPEERKTATIQVIGEKAVSPTINSEGFTQEKGTPIRLSGTSGSAEQISLDYWAETGENSAFSKSIRITPTEGQWTAEIATPASGSYSFTARGIRNGRSTGSAYIEVIVTGEDSLPAPEIEATPNYEGSNQVYIHIPSVDAENGAYIMLRATAPDGTIINSDNWYANAGEDIHTNWYFDYVGTYTLTAVYRINGKWSMPATATVDMTAGRPWPIYGPVPINVNVPTTWPAGEDLTIHWTPEAAGQTLSTEGWIIEGNNDRWMQVNNSWIEKEEDVTIEGYQLKPGETIRIRFVSSLDYWETNSKEYRISITENEEQPEIGTVTTAPENINTLCTVTLTLDRVYDRGVVTVNDIDNVYFWYKNKAIIQPYMLKAGENKAVIRAMVNGVWSREKEITFTAEMAPTLDMPIITMDDNLQIGEGTEVTIVCDENAEQLSVSIVTEMETPFYETYKLGSNKTVTIQLSEEAFSAGQNILSAETTAKGYYDGYTWYIFNVAGERPGAPAVRLSKTAGEAGETVYATIVTRGITQIRSQMWGENIDEYYSPVNGKCVIPIKLDFYGRMGYTFRTQIDGIWSKWSDEYTIETGAGPGLDVPEDGYVVMPEEIVSGEDVPITFREVEGATHYYVNVSRFIDDLWEYNYYGEISEPGTITIPAVCFVEGGTYLIETDVGCSYYYPQGGGSYLYGCCEYEVEASNTDTWPELEVTTDKEQAVAGEEFTIRLKDVQAEEIQVMQEREDVTELLLVGKYDKPVSEFSMSHHSPETIRIRVRAKVNGQWTKLSEVITITITENNGKLKNPIITAIPDRILEGDPLTMRWESIDGAVRYAVSWYNIDKDTYGYIETTDASNSITIPADWTEAGRIRFLVMSIPENGVQNTDRTYCCTITVEESYEGSTLTLPNGLREIEAEAFMETDASVVIIPASCQTIGNKAFAYSPSLTMVEIKGGNTSIAADAFEGCGELTVKAPSGSRTADNLISIGITPVY